MTEKNKPPRRETPVEQRIREAIERGDFDRLPGAGRPLDLDENPYTPAEWRLAFKVLKDAGLAPDWIEQDKEIRRQMEALERWLEEQAERLRRRQARMGRLAPHAMIAEHERLASARDEAGRRYRSRAEEINGLIDVFNLKAPIADLHRARIPIEEKIVKLLDPSS